MIDEVAQTVGDTPAGRRAAGRYARDHLSTPCFSRASWQVMLSSSSPTTSTAGAECLRARARRARSRRSGTTCSNSSSSCRRALLDERHLVAAAGCARGSRRSSRRRDQDVHQAVLAPDTAGANGFLEPSIASKSDRRYAGPGTSRSRPARAQQADDDAVDPEGFCGPADDDACVVAVGRDDHGVGMSIPARRSTEVSMPWPTMKPPSSSRRAGSGPPPSTATTWSARSECAIEEPTRPQPMTIAFMGSA